MKLLLLGLLPNFPASAFDLGGGLRHKGVSRTLRRRDQALVLDTKQRSTTMVATRVPEATPTRASRAPHLRAHPPEGDSAQLEVTCSSIDSACVAARSMLRSLLGAALAPRLEHAWLDSPHACNRKSTRGSDEATGPRNHQHARPQPLYSEERVAAPSAWQLSRTTAYQTQV